MTRRFRPLAHARRYNPKRKRGESGPTKISAAPADKNVRRDMKLEMLPSVAGREIKKSGETTPAAAAGASSTGSGGSRGSGTGSADGIAISNASAALHGRAKVERLAAAVQGGAYRVSSAATGKAIVRDAL